MSKQIFIRTDANSQIASGHLMRCICIAKAIKRSGGDVCFLFSDNNAELLIKKHSFRYIVMNTRWDRLEEEIEKMRELIIEKQIECLLIDSYLVTEKYLLSLNKMTKTFYIDDFLKTPYKVEGIFSYLIGASKDKYRKQFPDVENELYIGSEYIPLREEFFESHPIKIKKKVNDILITVGGADDNDITSQILNVLLKYVIKDDKTVHVVIGKYFRYADELEKAYKESENIRFYRNCTSMSSIMKMCDYAVTAAGTTLYEMAVLGIPVICISIAENQVKTAQTLGEQNAILYAGYYEKNQEKVLDNIKVLAEEIENYQLRKSLSEVFRKYTDGKGAERIAKILVNAVENKKDKNI